MIDHLTSVPWVLSAQTEETLRARARLLANQIDAHPELSIRDVGLSLASTRAALPHRAVALGAGHEQFVGALLALSEGRSAPGLVRGKADLVPSAGADGAVFVFPGQGSQWAGMAAELLETSPVFAESMAACAAALTPHVDWSLLSVARGEPGNPSWQRADVVQPMLWAVMVSLAALWRSLGIEPAAVVGHSYGEVAAACVAGGLLLQDGARVVALAGNLVAEVLSGDGGMVLVGLPAHVVREQLARWGNGLSIAAVNGPASVVVSGAEDALAELTAHWSGRARLGRVDVDYASHSAIVARVEERLLSSLAPIRPGSSAVPFYSAVTGGRLDTATLNEGYWYRNLRHPVDFHAVTNQLVADGYRAFVEISPHPVLVDNIRDNAREAGIASVAIGTIRRDDAGFPRLLTSLAELYTRGIDVDWAQFFSDAERIELPDCPQSKGSWSTTELEPDPRSLVRAECAVLLGFRDPHRMELDRSFRELGFDSAMLMELVSRLNTAAGLTLTSSTVFDHPTPARLADFLNSPAAGRTGITELATVPNTTPVDEPIAIIGMGCRYPGGIDSPESLWRLVTDEVDAISSMPTDRGWPEDFLANGPGGGFLYDAGDFDPGFFGISPREALAMDPQQRLSLEVVWEALEHAGIDPTSLHGSRTGVFFGAMAQDYGPRLHEISSDGEGYTFTGTSPSVLSGRVSYVLGIQGPAVTVDTACSSSLVALHLAVQALRSGECGLVLAGGATVMATPGILMEFTKLGGLSPDGRCKAFASTADGTGFAEGVGVLVLERLSEALRHGREVLAVVRGSATNQDGASNGLAAPNGLAQQRVIRQALADARLSPREVDAVEAHGTGTVLGDPIEAQALLATYGQDRDQPVLLGSIKSNIGHTQAAAGLAGVIKMVLAIRHGVLPRTLHVDRPSGRVDWSTGAVELLVRRRDWPERARPRRAGVSSFGVSGTNAHVILEQAPSGSASTALSDSEAVTVLPMVVSARSAPALSAQAMQVASCLDAAVGLADAARSLVTGRTVWEHRAVVLASDRDQAVRGLRALVAGESAPGVVTGIAPKSDAGKTVLVFPGQGAQWAGMGQELWRAAPVFAARMRDCEEALAPHVNWSLSEVIMGAADAVMWDRVDVVQPVSFAVMVSLAALWQFCGVRPDAVVGHSQGEIAAAYVAGALSLADAARVVALRAKAIAAGLAGHGGMLSVTLPEGQVRQRVQACGGPVEVAAVNGPASVVIAGDPDALAEIRTEYAVRGVRTRQIPVDYASHTAEVETIRDELTELCAGIEPTSPTILWYSTVDGDWVSGPIDEQYWYRNLRRPVGFEPATRALIEQGFRVFVEVSSHPVLTTSVRDILADVGVHGVVCTTLRRDQGGLSRFAQSLAEGFVRGVAVDWTPLLPATGAPVALPTYPFQRQHFWRNAETVRDAVAGNAVDACFWDSVERGDAAALATELGIDGDQPWHAVLPALSRWRRSHRQRSVLDSWRYRIAWKPVTDLGPGMLSGRWLVVMPAHLVTEEIGSLCVQALTNHGARVVPMPVDAAGVDRAVLGERLRAVAAEGALAGVMSLLALERCPHPEHAVVPMAVAGTLALVQALGDADVPAPMWAVTQGAVSTGRPDDCEDDPDQASVWGMGRVVALEHPGRWGGLIDLPVTLDGRAMSGLCQVLAGRAGEDQVAVRASGVFGRRLVRAPLRDRDEARPWSPQGTVLITGGTGALGGHVARSLAGRGATNLVLVSRRGPAAPGARRLHAELSELGAAVRVVACDVADREALGRLLASMQPPVTSVVHTAGVSQFSGIPDIGMCELADVLAAKASGAAHLDELLADRPLEAFVVFSSGAATWGGGGQGAYAAANAFLDALVRRRLAQGRAGTSVAWGLWAGDGMGEGEVGEQLGRRGLLPMKPEMASAALWQSVEHHDPAVTIADIDWDRFIPSFTWTRHGRLLDELPEAAQQPARTATPERTSSGSQLTDRLAGLPNVEQLMVLTDLVRAEAAVVLGHSSGEQITGSQAFKDAGFDSLTGVELRDRLANVTGQRLPATLVYDYETPAAVARHLLSVMNDARPTRQSVRWHGALGEIYGKLAMRGQIMEMELLASAAAALRENSDSNATGTSGKVRVRKLSQGDDGPQVICIPSCVALPGEMQYDRLADAFREVSDLSVVLLPGYQPDEPLAPSLEALTGMLAQAVLCCARGEPFVLLGHSAGGLLAHEVATHLENEGARPGAMVLLDPLIPASMLERFSKALIYEIFTRRASFNDSFDDGITAMMTYLRMFRKWQPRPVATPTLVVRPSAGIQGQSDKPVTKQEWRAYWPLKHEEIEVSGDHFTMSVEHAQTTAEAVRNWLSALVVTTGTTQEG